MRRKLFCEYGPIAYKIALFKEAKKKDLKDLLNGKKFAKKETMKILSLFGKAIVKYCLENFMVLTWNYKKIKSQI